MIKDVESKTSDIPPVDEEGNSECPIIDQLFDQKQKAEEKLTQLVRQLASGVHILDREVSRCRNNIELIRSQGEMLNCREPQPAYSQAEQVQKRQYREAVQKQKELTLLIKRAELALEMARNKKPLGKGPRRSMPESSPGNELNDAISIGPLGENT